MALGMWICAKIPGRGDISVSKLVPGNGGWDFLSDSEPTGGLVGHLPWTCAALGAPQT